ncbi:MAG: MBL fold metallo-hydrolase [Thermoflexales bacterium]|nr:MBL fold metallo-hydrolase [Thermoflexales bacterium]
MRVKFWGTRGSIPTPISPALIEDKIRQALRGAVGLNLSDEASVERYLQGLPPTVRYTIGGNTACVEVRAGQHLLILDAGTGIRPLGYELIKTEFGRGQGEADVLISHTHWDHIQGLPFFVPGFIKGNRLTFHSPHANLEEAFTGQQDSLYFPVPLSYLSATIQFQHIAAATWSTIGDDASLGNGVRVYPLLMSHPGENYGYRIEHDGHSLVYASDSEYKRMSQASTQDYVDFFQGADLLIFDAQYTLSDSLDKVDWGHSSPLMGAEFAYRAGVRRLALFHHDPLADDQAVYAGLKQAETYLAKRGSPCQVMIAGEGLEIEW